MKNNYRLSDTETLIKETTAIKRLFAGFLARLQQHILSLQENGVLDISVVKSQLVMYDRQLKEPMSHCSSLEDIFTVISSPKHSSILDYELVKVLVDYGNDEIQSELSSYKKELQKFLENRMSEHSSGGEKSYVVVLDETITDGHYDLTGLQNRVRIILGQKNVSLLVRDLQPMKNSSEREVDRKSIILSEVKDSEEFTESDTLSQKEQTVHNGVTTGGTFSIAGMRSDTPEVLDSGEEALTSSSSLKGEGDTSEAVLAALSGDFQRGEYGPHGKHFKKFVSQVLLFFPHGKHQISKPEQVIYIQNITSFSFLFKVPNKVFQKFKCLQQ